jgi:hypothetical protein
VMTARASARRIAWRTAPGNVSQRRSWSSREPGSSERQVTPWGCSPGDLAGIRDGDSPVHRCGVDLGCLSHARLGAPPSAPRRPGRGRGSKGRTSFVRAPEHFGGPSARTPASIQRRRSRPARRAGRGGFRGEFLGRTSAQHGVWWKLVVAGAGGALAHPPAADHPQVRLWASWNRTSTRGTGRPEDACAMGSFQSGFGRMSAASRAAEMESEANRPG